MKTYQYRAYPTAAQEALLAEWQETLLDLQRWCIKQRRFAQRTREAFERAELPLNAAGLQFPDPTWRPDRAPIDCTYEPTAYAQNAEYTARRNDERYMHWKRLPYDTATALIERVEKAWGDAQIETRRRRAWNAANPGKKPRKDARARWADRASDVGIDFPKKPSDFVVDGKYAALTMHGAKRTLGSLRFRYHRAFSAEAEMRTTSIVKKADGWYLNVTCREAAPEPLPETGHTIGVDLNGAYVGTGQQVAAVSDGRIYCVPDGLKQSAAKLAHYQRLIDPKRLKRRQGAAKRQGKEHGAKAADPTSNRTQRRQQRIARLHQRVARQRKHNQDYVVNRLRDTADTIKFEDTDWSALRHKKSAEERESADMTREHEQHINRSMASASPGALRELTRQKAGAAGREVVTVDAAHTTTDCFHCGHRQEMNWSSRTWICKGCGETNQVDINAARQIARREPKERKKRKARSNYKPRAKS
jgi:putative transposase